jgi:hypothetical protein
VKSPERRLSGFLFLTRHLQTLLSHNGVGYTAKRLKIYLFCLYSFIAGNPLQSTQELGFRVRLTGGLPKVIPPTLRREIREMNLVWIRIWASLFNIYRAFLVKTPDPETAYKTIRKQKPILPPALREEFEYFASYVFPRLLEQEALEDGQIFPVWSYTSQLGKLIRSAATNLRGSMSVLSIILDAQAWVNAPRNFILEWFELHEDHAAVALFKSIASELHFPTFSDIPYDYSDMEDLTSPPPFGDPKLPKGSPEAKASVKTDKAEWESEILQPFLDTIEPEASLSTFFRSTWRLAREVQSCIKPILGRLFNFDAPGGKLRTVAICDYWTQLAMFPVHEYLFKILKILHRNDATFNQDGTVDSYWQRKYAPHWSFDLSAATDSIPVELYRMVLAPLFRDKDGDLAKAHGRANLWVSIMTDREFAIPSPEKGEIGYTGKHQYRTIRYETGQPMGAYSSWASMAIVHHALVQFAHWKAEGKPQPVQSTWFDPYLVLGDDVDIARDENVALGYQAACAGFEIKIGLAKSLHSLSNFFEFANQRLCELGNISPLSLMEEVQAKTWSARKEFASRIMRRFDTGKTVISLIRLVTTARQWQFVTSELLGARPAVFVSLIKFILLNPVEQKPHEVQPQDVNIVNVREWLQLLEGDLRSRELLTLNEWKSVQAKLCNSLIARIDTMLASHRDDLATAPEGLSSYGLIPPLPLTWDGPTFSMLSAQQAYAAGPSAHYKCHTAYSDQLITVVTRLVRYQVLTRQQGFALMNMLSAFPTNILVPRGCPITYVYLFYCAHLINESTRKDLEHFTKELEALRSINNMADIPLGAMMFLDIKVIPAPLAELVQLFWKVSALQPPIRLDKELTPEMLGKKVAAADATEQACILLREILPVIVERTGIAVTSLPLRLLRGSGAALQKAAKKARQVKSFIAKVKYDPFKLWI